MTTTTGKAVTVTSASEINWMRIPQKPPRVPRVERDRKYYLSRLEDPSLLDGAVVAENARIARWTDGIPEWGPLELPTLCVPCGGSRRGGDCGGFPTEEEAQKVIDKLRGAPGFPNPRYHNTNVRWGEDLPKMPDCPAELRRLHADWLYGRYYGYSVRRIAHQLGRAAAMIVAPDFLELEQAAAALANSDG